MLNTRAKHQYPRPLVHLLLGTTCMFGQAKKMVYQNAEVKIYQVKDKAGVKYVGVNSAGMPVTVTVMSKKQAVKGSVKFPDCSECCGYDKKGKCICYKFYQCGQPK